jgi:hypothetical protein
VSVNEGKGNAGGQRVNRKFAAGKTELIVKFNARSVGGGNFLVHGESPLKT